MSELGGFDLAVPDGDALPSTPAPAADSLAVTLHLSGSRVQIGRLLDTIEHAAALGHLRCVIETEAFQQAFYGWEPAGTSTP